jgi:hypothetical protein
MLNIWFLLSRTALFLQSIKISFLFCFLWKSFKTLKNKRQKQLDVINCTKLLLIISTNLIHQTVHSKKFCQLKFMRHFEIQTFTLFYMVKFAGKSFDNSLKTNHQIWIVTSHFYSNYKNCFTTQSSTTNKEDSMNDEIMDFEKE